MATQANKQPTNINEEYHDIEINPYDDDTFLKCDYLTDYSQSSSDEHREDDESLSSSLSSSSYFTPQTPPTSIAPMSVKLSQSIYTPSSPATATPPSSQQPKYQQILEEKKESDLEKIIDSKSKSKEKSVHFDDSFAQKQPIKPQHVSVNVNVAAYKKKKGVSSPKKKKGIRKNSRAIKGSIPRPKLDALRIKEDDGSETMIEIRFVNLFARVRTHHRLNNFKNINYASKSYQMDAQKIINALDADNELRGELNIDGKPWAFVKKHIGQQKEYKIAMRVNSDKIGDAIAILNFFEAKLDESLQTIKKITKFDHDVCFHSIIAELIKK